MNPEIVQLAAAHGTRSASAFWGWELAAEMFLSGTAGALMFFMGIRNFSSKVASILRWVSLACLLVAGVLLLFDLGAPLHVHQLFLNWRPHSVLFWGTWVFAFSLIASLLRFRRISAALGFGLMLYPGLLLASMAARSAWRGPWMPLEFIALSLASGVAVVMLVEPALNRNMRARTMALGILAAVLIVRAAVLFAGQG